MRSILFLFFVSAVHASPSVMATSAKAESQGRQLWLSASWDWLTSKVSGMWAVVEDYLPYFTNPAAVVFPDVIDSFREFKNKVVNGVNHVDDLVENITKNSNRLWENVSENIDSKDGWFTKMMKIAKNVDQVIDCNVRTYEVWVDMKPGADQAELLAEINKTWKSFDIEASNKIKNISISNKSCDGRDGIVQIEFDIDVRDPAMREYAEGGDFKHRLEQWYGHVSNRTFPEPTNIYTYLADQQDDMRLNTELTFCEAYSITSEDFKNSSESYDTIKNQMLEEESKLREQMSAFKDFWVVDVAEDWVDALMPKVLKIGDIIVAIKAYHADLKAKEEAAKEAVSVQEAAIKKCGNGELAGHECGYTCPAPRAPEEKQVLV